MCYSAPPEKQWNSPLFQHIPEPLNPCKFPLSDFKAVSPAFKRSFPWKTLLFELHFEIQKNTI